MEATTLDTSKAKHKSVFSKNKKQPVYKLLITSRESREFAKTIKVSKPKKTYSENDKFKNTITSFEIFIDLGGLGHVNDQVDHTGTVTPFVVIPRHQLHEVVTQRDSSLCVKNA